MKDEIFFDDKDCKLIDQAGLGHCDELRYGINHVRRNAIRAAMRSAYEKHVGTIPEGFHVGQRCDSGECINPEHLRLIEPNYLSLLYQEPGFGFNKCGKTS